MRREHIQQSQSYIDWLKSLGCLVWLPLHDDLQDKISGTYIQPTGSGTFQYDSSVAMQFITTPSSYGNPNSSQCYVGFLNTDISSSKFPTNCWTWLLKIKRYSTSGAYAPFGLLSYTGTYWGLFSGSYNGTQGMQSFPDNAFDFAGIVDGVNHTRASYQNGIKVADAAEASQLLPSNWSYTTNGIVLGYSGDYSRRSKSFYVSDFYLFNTVLDLATIRKIQGYE